ncbi:MAG: hypothetical protein WCF94_00350 [bacterium]
MKRQCSLIEIPEYRCLVSIHHTEAAAEDPLELKADVLEIIDKLGERKVKNAIKINRRTCTVGQIVWQEIPVDDTPESIGDQKQFFSLLEYLGVVAKSDQSGFDIYYTGSKVLILNTEDEKLHFARESDAEDYAKRLFGENLQEKGVSIVPFVAVVV